MPHYDYLCQDCLKNSNSESDSVFETKHSMSASGKELLEATECPRCSGHNTEKFFGFTKVIGYIRGNGLVNDRAGAKRDMLLHKLHNDDPYADMRQPGEADDLKIKLKRAGQHNPNPKHFT